MSSHGKLLVQLMKMGITGTSRSDGVRNQIKGKQQPLTDIGK